MSKRLAAVFVFLALVCPAARAQVEGVRELAPGVYFWQGDRDKHQPANCTWVVFKDYVFVIDANYPWATREIMQKIKMTTDKPVRYVLDTHYHSDHAFGNYLYADAGATILCSEACSEELHTKGIAAWNSYKDPGGYSIEGAAKPCPASRTWTRSFSTTAPSVWRFRECTGTPRATRWCSCRSREF